MNIFNKYKQLVVFSSENEIYLDTNGKKVIKPPYNHSVITESNWTKNHKSFFIGCGERSNIIVVDFDTLKKGEQIKSGLDLYAEYFEGIKTLKAKTPSGGLHVFFNYTDKVKNTTKMTFDGVKYAVDILSDGKLVVCAPTYVKDVGQYKWLNEYDIIDIPLDILNKINDGVEAPPLKEQKPTAKPKKVELQYLEEDYIINGKWDIKQYISELDYWDNNDYESWLRVGVLMYNIFYEENNDEKTDIGLDLWLVWSSVDEEKFKQKEIYKKWNTFNKKYKYSETGIFNLLKLIIKQNPDNHWIKEELDKFTLHCGYYDNNTDIRLCKKPVKVETNWIDFINKWNYVIINDNELLLDQFYEELKDNYAIVRLSKNKLYDCVRKLDLDNGESLYWEIDKTTKSAYTYFNIRWKTTKKVKMGKEFVYEEVINDYKFCDWFDKFNAFTKVNVYDNIEFNPNSTNSRILNTFNGFRLKPYGEAPVEKDDNDIKPILDHIFNVFSNKQQISFDYIIKWMASLVQGDINKNKTALTFKSEKQQWTGKTHFWTYFFNTIFGKQYVLSNITSIDRLNTRFNWNQYDKLFCILEEATFCGDSKNANQMKARLTNDRWTFEQKNGIIKEMKDYLSFIILTNNDIPMKIESEDRRYAFFECNEETTFSKEYWINLFQDTMKNDFKMSKFYRFLMDIDISDFNIQDIPLTEFRKDQIEYCRKPFDKWWEEYTSKDYFNKYRPLEQDTIEIHDDIEYRKVQNDVIFKHYEGWLIETKEYDRFITKNMLMRKISKKILRMKKADGYFYYIELKQ